MSFREETVAILSDSEQRLRELIVQAMQEGDPSAIRVIQATVISLRQLRVKLSGGHVPASGGTQESGIDTAQGFPRFLIQDGHLIRIGWSRRHQKKYICRVPRETFAATVRAMRVLAARGAGQTVKIEQILRQIELNGDAEVPRRGVFLALGMLQEQGKIQQDHTGAYRIPADIGAIALQGFRQAV